MLYYEGILFIIDILDILFILFDIDIISNMPILYIRFIMCIKGKLGI